MEAMHEGYSTPPHEQSPSSPEAFVLPELLPEEQPEEYLSRITMLLEGSTSNPNPKIRLAKGLNSQANSGPVFAKATLKVENECSEEKFSESKREGFLAGLPSKIKFANNEGKVLENGELGFGHTKQDRWFYGTAAGADHSPMSQLLFGLHCDPELHSDPEIQQYLKRELDGKSILLLGGGDSVKDLIVDMDIVDSRAINPKKIINADLSFEGLNPEPLIQPALEAGRYVREVAHAEKPEEITDVLKRNLLAEGVDQIWASFSVPYYLGSVDQIEGLFNTISTSLAEGGTARISPLVYQAPHDKLAYAPEELDAVKAAMVNEITRMSNDPHFNVYSFNAGVGETLVIKRLKSVA